MYLAKLQFGDPPSAEVLFRKMGLPSYRSPFVMNYTLDNEMTIEELLRDERKSGSSDSYLP